MPEFVVRTMVQLSSRSAGYSTRSRSFPFTVCTNSRGHNSSMHADQTGNSARSDAYSSPKCCVVAFFLVYRSPMAIGGCLLVVFLSWPV